ncbi:helix-turn-helix domain-containing protein [Microbacterium sp. SORGH_AS_0888]|uniref:helix-turn-helix domain-containing protein n=1 Tax=Microbacterium sp. SORGH_AS_0888 TaxID=3041791 RepID=UPI00278953AC|nr:helix-turn-helix domain-containing protein [Microbacterium sp. SORGH_AS_0888]MDQ1131268.1 transcriptional regulator with XRE-family HTH domain [Microbacterium sp. SORGH_AS_0888]
MTDRGTTQEADAFARSLGAVIRGRRQELGLRLVEVAKSTGLSHSFLSQLERGRTRASMRSLFAVARTLNTTQQELLALAAGPDSANAPESPLSVIQPQTEAHARLLMHSDSQVDVTEFVGLPFESGEFFSHERPEFIYVVQGSIEFEMRVAPDSGGSVQLLQQGQSVLCPGSMLHRYRSVGARAATVLMIQYPA